MWLQHPSLTTPPIQCGWGKPVSGILRFWDTWDGLSDGEYVFGRWQGRHTISFHTMTYALYISQLLVPTHSCQAFTDQRNLCGSSQLGTQSDPLTFYLRSMSQNHSFSWKPFGFWQRRGRVFVMSSLWSSSAPSPHHDHVNIGMNLEAMRKLVSRCTSSLKLGKVMDANVVFDRVSWERHSGCLDHAYSQNVIVWVLRWIWRPWLSELRDAVLGRDWAS